jgi:hypothetical protein
LGLASGGLGAGEFGLGTSHIYRADFGDFGEGCLGGGDLLVGGGYAGIVVGLGFGELLLGVSGNSILGGFIFDNLLVECGNSLIVFRLSFGNLLADGIDLESLGIEFGGFDRPLGIQLLIAFVVYFGILKLRLQSPDRGCLGGLFAC